jgi:CheY-like chemotaxis protein
MKSSKNILIIEDNPLNLELARDILEDAGYVVYTAVSAEKGIQLAHSVMPDLILMDVSLPGMDGLSATRLLTNDPETAKIPIVFLTAHAMHGDKEKAIAAGCKGYLTKPIDTRTFAKCIDTFLENSLTEAA